MRTVGWLAAILMVAALGYGFATGDFGADGSVLLGLVWGRVTVVDLYIALGVFAVWIWWREPSRAAALVWTVALATLGSLALGVYLVTRGGRAEAAEPSPRHFP
jgi:hypothetical protein